MSRPTLADYDWMTLAIALAHQCPPSSGAFSVGAVIVDQQGKEISRGYSRETDSHAFSRQGFLELSWPGESRVFSSQIAKAMNCSPRPAW